MLLNPKAVNLMAKIRKVYDVTTNTLYDSISAAAKALGVDSSNLRKVVNGTRKSIAGHNFIEAGNLSSRQLKKRGKKFVSSLSPSQLSKQAKARGEDLELLSLQNEVYNLTRKANGRLAELKKKRVLEFSGAAKEILRLRETLGYNTNGLLNGSKINISKLNKAELNSIKESLKAQLERESLKVGTAYGEANRIADILGVRTPYVIKHRKALDVLWDVLDSCDTYGMNSDIIVNQVADLMESGKSTKYIIEFLETNKNYVKTRDEVFELFDVAKMKWDWINNKKELEGDIIKLIKLQQLHPNSEMLNDTVKGISKLLKKSRSKKAFENIVSRIDTDIAVGIHAAQLELNISFDDDLEDIITFADVLEFL